MNKISINNLKLVDDTPVVKRRKSKSKEPKPPKINTADPRKLGSIFQDEVGASLRKLQEEGIVIAYGRFSDTTTFQKQVVCPYCHKKFHSKMMTPKQPADYWVVTETQVYFLECKASKKVEYFPLSNIKEHQLEYARMLEKGPVKFYFVINDRRYVRRFRTYAVRYSDIMDILFYNKRKSSLPWSELEEECISVPQLSKGLWDLKAIIV